MSNGTPQLNDWSTPHDSIQIKNLQLPFPVVAPDVWGNSKEQPVLLSVRLRLHDGFSTAADADKLDDSTIHYGNLAKAIRASSQQGQSLDEVFIAAEREIQNLARKSEGKFVVAESAVIVHLHKASMLGTGILFTSIATFDQSGQRIDDNQVFELRDLTIPTLIGVNAYERALNQPLVVSLTLGVRPAEQSITYEKQETALFSTEKTLVEIIQNTAYETLETLVEVIYTQLMARLPNAAPPGTRLRLRIEKPRAIAFADAPVLEIVRVIPDKDIPSRTSGSVANMASGLSGLKIVKPYSAAKSPSVLSGLSIVKPYSA